MENVIEVEFRADKDVEPGYLTMEWDESCGGMSYGMGDGVSDEDCLDLMSMVDGEVHRKDGKSVFLPDLEKRGFDLSTLKFSIQKY